MNPVVTTQYQEAYLVLSFALAFIGSLVALTAATRIRRRDGSLSLLNTIAAGIALGGIGVWAMHFVGMLALKMDVSTSYAVVESTLSLVAAVVVTSLALAFVARSSNQLPRLFAAGTALGLGVVVMHYLGMYGLRFGGYIRWDYGIVATSIAIAVIAATAALWLAFNTTSLSSRMGASVVMAGAVCAMHYTGMAAADFVCTTADRMAFPQGFALLPSADLPALVTVAALMMAFLIAIDQFFQRTVQAPRRVQRA